MEREQGTAWARLDVVAVFRHGAIGGVVAGITFVIAEVVAAVLSGLPAWAPLQMIAAIALGDRVLTGADLTAQILLAALGVHMALSIVYGLILAVVAMASLAAGSSVRGMTLGGMVWGLALWIVNFYLIAPFAFPWFTVSDQVVQFIAHVFFYGAVLGYYLGKKLSVPKDTAR